MDAPGPCGGACSAAKTLHTECPGPYGGCAFLLERSSLPRWPRLPPPWPGKSPPGWPGHVGSCAPCLRLGHASPRTWPLLPQKLSVTPSASLPCRPSDIACARATRGTRETRAKNRTTEAAVLPASRPTYRRDVRCLCIDYHRVGGVSSHTYRAVVATRAGSVERCWSTNSRNSLRNTRENGVPCEATRICSVCIPTGRDALLNPLRTSRKMLSISSCPLFPVSSCSLRRANASATRVFTAGAWEEDARAERRMQRSDVFSYPLVHSLPYVAGNARAPDRIQQRKSDITKIGAW